MARLLPQRVDRLSGKFGLAVAWLCACLLPSGCAETATSTAVASRSFAAPTAIHAPMAIGVLVAGWHSGIVLPAGEMGTLGSVLRERPQAKYLSVGWGNRRFYMAAHPGSGDAIAALFGSPSVLFVQVASTPADLSVPGARIYWLCADRDEIWRLDDYIEQSLSRTGGKPAVLGPGPVPGSRFYSSTGHYSGVHTCNTWTVGALQYAGLPVKARGVVFASQVDRRVARLRVCLAP